MTTAMTLPQESISADSHSALQFSASNTSSTKQDLSNYVFPDFRLKKVMDDVSKIPVLLVACGSFSPITYQHLRMFEMVADHVKFVNTEFEIIGGYLSPVADDYKKVGLASAGHRIRMCDIAVQQTSSWLMTDPWEAIQDEYTRTALVLDHFDHEINVVRGGVESEAGERKQVRVALLAGADLVQSMLTPDLWSAADLDYILGRCGAFVIERTGTDMDKELSHLEPWKKNIYIIPQLIQNDVSSTKIRLFLRKKMSVRYLIPAPLIDYIEEHGLYEDESGASKSRRQRRLAGDSSVDSLVELKS